MHVSLPLQTRELVILALEALITRSQWQEAGRYHAEELRVALQGVLDAGAEMLPAARATAAHVLGHCAALLA